MDRTTYLDGNVRAEVVHQNQRQAEPGSIHNTTTVPCQEIELLNILNLYAATVGKRTPLRIT